MNTHLQKLFNKAVTLPAPTLSDAIWHAIVIEQKRRKAILVWSYSFLGFVSLSTLVFVIKDIATQFTQSGFYEYVSLLSSDSGMIATYWKEFLLSLTESLPLFAITFSLLLLFVVALSMRQVTRQYRGQLLTV
jgi:hypothetical protein